MFKSLIRGQNHVGAVLCHLQNTCCKTDELFYYLRHDYNARESNIALTTAERGSFLNVIFFKCRIHKKMSEWIEMTGTFIVTSGVFQMTGGAWDSLLTQVKIY